MAANSLTRVYEKIDALREKAVDILAKLVSIPTVNPPGENYEEITGLISDILQDHGIATEKHRVPKQVVEKYYPEHADYPRIILVARIPGETGKTLHLNGHYDVVPAGMGWTHPPFEPRIAGGRLYGRGASDMKGGLASIILALIAVAEAGWTPPVGLEASFTPDEETGGETGVYYMLEAGIAKPDYAVVAEPSGINRIWVGNKGAVWAKIKVYGKQAHASTPWEGVNAFEKAVDLVQLMRRELVPRIEAKKSSYDYGDPRAAKATINIGGEAGVVDGKTNTVPGLFYFTVDRRVIPEETADEAAEELKSFVERASERIPGLRAEVEIVSKFDAAVTDPGTPFVQKAVRAVEAVTGVKPATTICIGGLDTRYFQVRGIPAVTYGPGEDSVAHKADEYIVLDNIPVAAKVYATLASLLP